MISTAIGEKTDQNVPWNRGRQINYEPRFEIILPNLDRIEYNIHVNIVDYYTSSEDALEQI